MTGAWWVAVLHPPAEASAGEAAALVEAVRSALIGASVREDHADALRVVASASELGPALDAAFAAVAAGRRAVAHVHGRPPVTVGIGWGPAAPSPMGWIGPEVFRAWSLAALGTGEILATEALVRSAPMPAGVGSFRAPPAREALTGVAAYVLGDFRG